MAPCRENTILFRSSQQLPRLGWVPLKGFLSLHLAPSKGPSTCLVRYFRNYSDTRKMSGVLH